MAKAVIDEAYLRRFFNIDDSPDGAAECAQIRDKLEKLTFGHGEDICTIDGEPDGMFFLETGVCAVLDREGEQINLMREGQYFGEYGALSGQRRLSTVRSVGTTVVYKLKSEDMMEILSRHPSLYGDLMKAVYAQVSRKHTQLLALSRLRRGILQVPDSMTPLTKKQMLLNYGVLVLIFVMAALLPAENAGAATFLMPMALMVGYVLFTKRTLEALVVSGMLASFMMFRSGLSSSYTDALQKTIGDPDNVFTVLVMALMGSVITLVEASGAVTAFQKIAEKRIRTQRGAMLGAIGVMAVTAIDDCLNMLCAAVSIRPSADEQRLPHEHLAFLLSFLPTALSSFVPYSLWGIFVIGTVGVSVEGSGAGLFCRSIPFNFFSILTVLASVLLCFDRMPKSKKLLAAEARVESGGDLWPADSERYLPQDEPTAWGKPLNLLLPVAVLAITSLAVRSLWTHSLVLDSACGLVATLIFLFFFYCGQGLMSPAQFAENLVTGIQSMVLPILLYLLTMCFSSLLNQDAMMSFFLSLTGLLGPISSMMPAMLFLVFTLLTVALGSSWAMYVIGFPVAIHLATMGGLHLPLCIGAICAAGIAGEKNCVFTEDANSVGSAIGCNPKAVLAVRLPYSLLLTTGAFLMYLYAGLLI